MSIVCDTGFINIVDPFLNPDSTVWTGSITYTLQYATTVAGATLVEARQVINVSDGIDICLAPGLYTVVYNQSGQRLPVTSQWTVPPTGGPYTIADLEGVGPVTGSLTVTGPFIAMSTVTMTSLINAAARPYVASDSVGLLSTGNLALIAISGSASDLASGTVAAARGGAGTLSGLLKANGAGVVSAAVAGTDYAVATNGTLGQVLTSNAAGGFSTALTLAAVATSGSASDLSAGTLAAARMPALTGDVTTTVGTVATTVSKINGTTLSGLATGLLKNTTATGVPSIAVAGTDLIGGVGNLTTVGAVPYVSATGTINQDASVLFWDASNDRLGVGTNTGITQRLTIGSGNILLDNTYGLRQKSSSGTEVTLLSMASNDNITMNAPAGGDIYVRGSSALVVKSDSSVILGSASSQAYWFDVTKSGGNGTAQFKDRTATTGFTRVLIARGAADTTSTQLLEVEGLIKFSGLNSTGAGTALLGTNSPAVTNTAPYTWFKVLTSDGSTAYIPVWK